jgi:hypothetical protein
MVLDISSEVASAPAPAPEQWQPKWHRLESPERGPAPTIDHPPVRRHIGPPDWLHIGLPDYAASSDCITTLSAFTRYFTRTSPGWRIG